MISNLFETVWPDSLHGGKSWRYAERSNMGHSPTLHLLCCSASIYHVRKLLLHLKGELYFVHTHWLHDIDSFTFGCVKWLLNAGQELCYLKHYRN